MDKLIKESIQLSFEKEGFHRVYEPKCTETYRTPPWYYVTLSGKTKSGKILTYEEFSYKLSLAIDSVRGKMEKLYRDCTITINTLEDGKEEGVLIDTLKERHNWYKIFLDYLDED